MIRVFIADDEDLARERLKALLEDLAATLPTSVVGEARNGLEALEALPASGAEVVLLDIQMPGMGGLELARHLAGLEQPPAVVFVTAHDRHAVEAFELNALDYLLKPVRAERLLESLMCGAEPALAGAHVKSERGRRLADGQLLEFDEHQQLALIVTERGERVVGDCYRASRLM